MVALPVRPAALLVPLSLQDQGNSSKTCPFNDLRMSAGNSVSFHPGLTFVALRYATGITVAPHPTELGLFAGDVIRRQSVSRKLRSFSERDGCRSLRNAFASI